jgi:putative ABC transport system permease protein
MVSVFEQLAGKTRRGFFSHLGFWMRILVDLSVLSLRAWSGRMLSGARHGAENRSGTFPTEVATDVKHSLRLLRRNPSFSLVAVGTIALGIMGATTAFTVVNGALLRPLPYGDPDGLVALFQTESNGPRLAAPAMSGSQRNPTSPGNYLEWKRDAAELVDLMTAARPWNPVMTGMDRPARLDGLEATYELFELLEVQPLLGRTFTGADVGSPNLIVLSYATWQGAFGGTTDVIGLKVNLDGEGYEVIGVMPPVFKFPPFWAVEAGMWVPLELGPEAQQQRRAAFLRVFGRLRPGVTLPVLAERMNAIAARLEDDYSWSNAGIGVNVETLSEPALSAVRPTLIIITGAVAILLLIACTNVANLLLSRATARQSELAVRASLGAGRGRLVRQWMTESLVLALVGGATGMLLSVWLTRPMSLLVADLLPVTAVLEVDLKVLAFATVVSVAAGVLFGTVPALLASRSSFGVSLRRGRTLTGSSKGVKTALVTVEIALAVTMLSGAGLLTRTFLSLLRHDPGFSQTDVVAYDLSFGASHNGAFGDRLATYGTLLEEVTSLPGVRAAGLVNHLPVGSDLWGTRYLIQSRPTPAEGEEPRATFRVADIGYADAIGLRLLTGSWFDGSETADSDPVIVVNQKLADDAWPDRPAVGERVRLGRDDTAPVATVIGVYADVGQGALTEEVKPELFYPISQDPTAWNTDVTLVISGSNVDGSLVDAVRQMVWDTDADVPITNVRTIEAILRHQSAREKTSMMIVGGLALAALILSAIGLYGVLSYLTSQRSREIGVRVALGASSGRILRNGLGEGFLMVIPGFLLGIGGSLVVGRLLESLLWQVRPGDPLTLAAVSVLLGMVSLAATIVPVRRASLIDPAVVLREE